MLYWLKSKDYRKASTLLQSLGMVSADFREFQIQQINSHMKTCEVLLPSVLQVMLDMKLSPLKALKIVLFCFQIFHFSNEKKAYLLIFDFLRQFQQKINALIHAKKGTKKQANSDMMSSSKEFLDRSNEIVEIDFSSIIWEKIVIPLICFQQKLIAGCGMIYDRDRKRAIGQAQIWLYMNLMRKITDIGPDIQSLGRYYFKQSASGVICLMKVINYDIQLLYRRIMEYIRKKIAVIQVLIEQHKMNMEVVVQQQKLHEFLMMIDELQIINQKLRVLYNGRYFIFRLSKSFIYIPALLTPDQNIDLVYEIREHQNRNSRKNRSIQVQRKKKEKAPNEKVDEI